MKTRLVIIGTAKNGVKIVQKQRATEQGWDVEKEHWAPNCIAQAIFKRRIKS